MLGDKHKDKDGTVWETMAETTIEQHESPASIEHPDLEWARQIVRDSKGSRVSESDLDTLCWDGLCGCYMMAWCGMVLGIEPDGHIHS